MRKPKLTKEIIKEVREILNIDKLTGYNRGIDAVDEFGNFVFYLGDEDKFYSFKVMSLQKSKQEKIGRVYDVKNIELSDIKDFRIKYNAELLRRFNYANKK